ncbi:MAG: hypothetical protein N3D11_18255, partial [Candidatus Sumerlaeia bacterium]|nr:hypothetical protein [Candidatus Sumerlaeia bacterium]
FEQWRTKYDKITQQFSTLGIRLVDDNEETISTEIKTNNLSENNNIDDGTVTQQPELPSENLSESSTTSDAVIESGQDVPLKISETADYEGVNEQEINHSFSPEESSLSDSSDSSDLSDPSDSSDTAETSTQTQPHETPSIPDLNTLLKNITPYPSEAVIALFHETLKA